MTLTWQSLFLETLRRPGEAAEQVLAMPLSRMELYLALVAGAALNASITGGTMLLFPLPDAWPTFMSQPLVYFVIVAGGLVLFSHALTWTGRGMGGEGTIDDILKLMIWLQFVRIALQVLGVVLMIVLPQLGALYYIAVMALSLWIVLHFVQAGHRLGSLGGAALVLFVTFVGLVLGLSLLLALVGVGSLGVGPDV